MIFFRSGISIDLYQGGYNEIASEFLMSESGLHEFAPELVIILVSHRDLVFQPEVGATSSQVESMLLDELLLWKNIWKTVSVPIVQLSFDPPPVRPLGELDGFTVGGLTDYVRRINRFFVDNAPSHVGFIDAEYLAYRVGMSRWHDPHLYHMSKQPFSFEVLPVLAYTVVSRSQGMLGYGKKVLVLDLDNTLWGGVVGDYGIEGVELGSETAEGESYTVFQSYIKELSIRGVILAVSSKNKEDIVRKMFNEHSGMVLKDKDIAHFEVNFEDKATNIRRIAAALNVGLDAIVFVDDNPIERCWVSEQLPEVLVVDLPKLPDDYPRALDQLNAFCTQRITEEDIGRSASYQARHVFTDIEHDKNAMNSFLQSLQSAVVIESVKDGSVDRIVQLIRKTNQFNLNQNKYTVDELRSMSDTVVVIRLKDRSQDYGIVSVVITKKIDNNLVVDNWVMSCRVFSRRLECAIQEVLIDKANMMDCKSIKIEYKETSRNGLLKQLLVDIGYTQECDGMYCMSLADKKSITEHYMEIIHMEYHK